MLRKEAQMFSDNKDFYPTPQAVIEMMIAGENLTGAVCLEPSAGKGNIVKVLKDHGAEVLACEISEPLRKILAGECRIIENDFLQVRSDQVSHITHIFMNPPFSADEKHILHAWEIAPAGCVIVALCNWNTLNKTYTKSREQLKQLIDENGRSENLGNVFEQSERYTGVEVGFIRMVKPGAASNEWEGFFLDEEPSEMGENGIMPYNLVRDIVNRYVESVKIYDQQLDTAARLNEMTGEFLKDKTKLSIQVTRLSVPVHRNNFKKELQKSGWSWIFEKMNLNKYATKGLREDINKFVETQEKIPFTMRNIYKMLEIVIGTTESRMDKAIIEVFDAVTKTYKENQYHVEGWATNSHYLINKRFIVGDCIRVDYHGRPDDTSGYKFEMIEDLVKAMCYITGDNYDYMLPLSRRLDQDRLFIVDDAGKYYGDLWGYHNQNHDLLKPGQKYIKHVTEWGQWNDWGYFKFRCYKKGTLHLEFKDDETWALFNQRVAKIKGYPLPSSTKKTKTEPMQRRSQPVGDRYAEPEILFSI